MVGRQALEIDFLKGALKSAGRAEMHGSHLPEATETEARSMSALRYWSSEVFPRARV
jgi:hypothetical protein